MKPSGKFVQEDLHSIGGTPAVMKYLLEKGYEVVGTSRSIIKNNSNHKKLKINGQFSIQQIDLLNFDEIYNLLLKDIVVNDNINYAMMNTGATCIEINNNNDMILHYVNRIDHVLLTLDARL